MGVGKKGADTASGSGATLSRRARKQSRGRTRKKGVGQKDSRGRYPLGDRGKTPILSVGGSMRRNTMCGAGGLRKRRRQEGLKRKVGAKFVRGKKKEGKSHEHPSVSSRKG